MSQFPPLDPLRSVFHRRLAQASGIVCGVVGTFYLFLRLVSWSFETLRPIEWLAGVIPAGAFCVFLALRQRSTAFRWFFLELFTSSLVTFLLLEFVVYPYLVR